MRRRVDRSYWCEYLEDWVAVKQAYLLSVDEAERDALKEGFGVCDSYKSGDALERRH